MAKSTTIQNNLASLAEMPTWQSGILQSAANRTTKRITDEFLSRYGLTTMHWLIIGAIYETGSAGIRLTDLARRIGTTSGYMTNTLNILERNSMVARSEDNDDSRAKTIIIPDKFRPQCLKIEDELRVELRHTIYKNITRKELAAYITVQQKLSLLT